MLWHDLIDHIINCNSSS